jgi:hypothetical protein
MTTFRDESLLSRLMRQETSTGNEETWQAVEATPGADGDVTSPEEDEKLAALLARVERLAGKKSVKPRTIENQDAAQHSLGLPRDPFIPLSKRNLAEMSLTESEVESLILKYLLARGDVLGRDIAEQTKLPFLLLEGLLRRLKSDQLVVYRGSNELNDYQYQLTDLGRCTYYGSAPVSLNEYIESVNAQSLRNLCPTHNDLEKAFSDMLVNRRMLDRLGPAVNSGRGMFLYGSPGNGKTSIARRVSLVFGEHIWIPRAIGVDGEIIRVFDPLNHIETPLESTLGLLDESKIDRRWVRIQRPTIVVGGELTMSQLDVTRNPATSICEAPLQMKSNCGTLVIDDFGRQRLRIDELLNRWIVPLEDRIDYLCLPSGKTIQVPFDQLIVFSTNLEPRDLVDEAFLRRIAYKIEVADPNEDEFRELFRRVAESLKIEYRETVVSDLIERHYKQAQRSFRCCHPRDLLFQVKANCTYQDRPLEMTVENLDFAVENYFAVM